jgi:type III secretion system HrpB2-like protein
MSVLVYAAQLATALKSVSGTSATPPAQALVDKFVGLMQRPNMVPPVAAPQGAGQNVVAKVLEVDDTQLQKTVDHMLLFSRTAFGMSLQKTAAESTQVMMELASVQVDMSVGMALATSSKSAVETLMKSQ